MPAVCSDAPRFLGAACEGLKGNQTAVLNRKAEKHQTGGTLSV